MKAYLEEEFAIRHESGAEITFRRDQPEVEVLQPDGTVVSFQGDLWRDLFDAGVLIYHMFDSCCIALGETCSEVFKITFEPAEVDKFSIHRTEETEEGFDYAYFLFLEEPVLFAYEYGLFAFAKNGNINWAREFPKLRCRPVVIQGRIVYAEIDRDYEYSIEDGRLL